MWRMLCYKTENTATDFRRIEVIKDGEKHPNVYLCLCYGDLGNVDSWERINGILEVCYRKIKKELNINNGHRIFPHAVVVFGVGTKKDGSSTNNPAYGLYALVKERKNGDKPNKYSEKIEETGYFVKCMEKSESNGEYSIKVYEYKNNKNDLILTAKPKPEEIIRLLADYFKEVILN